jgi:hypothetical protein
MHWGRRGSPWLETISSLPFVGSHTASFVGPQDLVRSFGDP